MRLRLVIGVLGLVALSAAACVPEPPPAGEPFEAVDQQNVEPFGATGASVWCTRSVLGVPGQTRRGGQSLRAARTGQLTKVSLLLVRNGRPGPLQITIQGLVDGLPDGNVLASASYGGDGSLTVTDLVDITFDAPAAVTAGMSYALVVSPTACGLTDLDSWTVGGSDYASGYFGGSLLKYDGSWRSEDLQLAGFGADLLFRTYVRSSDPVPQPLPSGAIDQSQAAPTVLPSSTGGGSIGACTTFPPPTAPRTLESQTFTAGRTGRIGKLALGLGTLSGQPSPNGVVGVTVQTVGPDGNPTGQVLGGGAFPSASVPMLNPVLTLFEITLSSPATVVAGTRYAIVLTRSCDSTGTLVRYFTNGPVDLYLGGGWASRTMPDPWVPNGVRDLLFTTWVTP